jgi:ATP-binding cassette subfamily B multidrug efflux pump
MEDEKVIAGYDPAIMRRLLGYTKPYLLMVVGALISLAISTTGDLLSPVIIQRAVDNQLIAQYRRVPDEAGLRQRLTAETGLNAVSIGGAVYVPDDSLATLGVELRSQLQAAGALVEEEYYLFPIPGDSEVNSEPRGAPAFVTFEQLVVDRGVVDGVEMGTIPATALDGQPAEVRQLVRGHDLEALKRTSHLFLVLILSVLVFTFAQIYLMALTGQGVMKDMRGELFSHTVGQSLHYLSQHPVGRLVTRVTNDIETVNQLFTDVLINLIRNVALMIGSVTTLMLLNWRLGLVTIATLPPVLLATVFFRKRAREAFRRVRVWVSRVNAFLSEHLSGMSVVQLFVQEKRTEQEFREQNEQLKEASLGEMYVFAVFRPIIDLLSSTSVAIVIYFGARFFISGLVSLGVLIAFINLIRRFYQPVMQISEQFTILQSAMAGSERVFEMIDVVDRIPDEGDYAPDESTRDEEQGRLEFEHVWFAYKPDEPVIKDLSFRVDPAETIAIVGYTGAGKTTIANLLTRLWDVQEGRILLDGRDVREYQRDTLRTVIQPIQQDVFLFSDTIKNNIRLGMPISDERVREVARMVQADTFIEKLPKGYDTMLTEGATNISTGQRQLLSFARILAHDPRIIIMDEATANIDTETEQLIQQAVETVMLNRTSLVIAHRLSTIKNANRILVLSNGRLAEEGSHEELIKLRGIYYNLYRLQYQESSEQVG